MRRERRFGVSGKVKGWVNRIGMSGVSKMEARWRARAGRGRGKLNAYCCYAASVLSMSDYARLELRYAMDEKRRNAHG